MMLLELVCQLAVDDGIYTLHQTCIAQFLHSRNTPFHPVIQIAVLIKIKCTQRKCDSDMKA